MKEHPHAEVLRAIADGVPLIYFEAYSTASNQWTPLIEWRSTLLHGDALEIRRKPQHIMVNGFKVPMPLDVMPFSGFVCCPDVGLDDLYISGDVSYTWVKRCFERGIAHSTKEAAIAHAKAMLGIDPEYFK